MVAGSSATKLSSVSTVAAEVTPRRRTRLGAGAGLLACALIIGILGGLGWGSARPAYVGEAGPDGVVVDQAASPANVEFAALGWFALITSLAGVLIALVAWRHTSRGTVRGGAGWLWWVIACAGAAAVCVYVFGDWFALFLNGVPSHEEMVDGATFTVVPPLNPRVAWLSGPFAATLVYWVANLLAYMQVED